MKIIGIIPARLASTRLERKVLVKISGKPMIQHVWEKAKKSQLLDEVIIACDDQEIILEAQKFGANAVLTSKKHKSGTDRITEVVKDIDVDIVLNIQGDEPLIHSSVIDDLAKALKDDKKCLMATVIKLINNKSDRDDPNIVKVVIDSDKNALYFSRSAIPFNRDGKNSTYYKHLGIYAYKKDFLLNFKDLPKSSLEETEKLEQLRVLEAGYRIKTVLTDMETVGVDTEEDLKKVEEILSNSK